MCASTRVNTHVHMYTHRVEGSCPLQPMVSQLFLFRFQFLSENVLSPQQEVKVKGNVLETDH